MEATQVFWLEEKSYLEIRMGTFIKQFGSHALQHNRGINDNRTECDGALTVISVYWNNRCTDSSLLGYYMNIAYFITAVNSTIIPAKHHQAVRIDTWRERISTSASLPIFLWTLRLEDLFMILVVHPG